ncbi:MAG: hypothetical protein ACJ75B_07555 [Flavisolibacter sp.]
MSKVVFNKWFILAALLLISLSAFSFVAYKKTRAICNSANECHKAPVQAEKGELIWDALSRQFSSVSVQ